MSRTENTELTILCLIHDDNRYLLQDRVSDDWKGFTLPGGHVEPGESIVEAVIREMKEETGLTVRAPKLCGIKQFPLKDGDYTKGRYLVFLYEATDFEGEVVSFDEGAMHWVDKKELPNVNLVEDFLDLIEVMLSDKYSEFQYTVEGDNWIIHKR